MNRMIDKQRKHAKRKAHIRKSISGTPERPRMTVFRSNCHMYIQIIDDTEGKTIVAVNSLQGPYKELKNTVADAEKLGEAAGKKLLEKNIDKVVFDRNGYMYHGIVKAMADGARKAGVQF